MTTERLSFTYGHTEIQFRVLRRPRKTLEIGVRPDLKVEVVAPLEATADEILEKVRKRAPWIRKQLRFFFQFQPRTPERRYLPGETHRYLGRQYRLKVIPAAARQVRLRGGFIEVCFPATQQPQVTQALVEGWFKTRAQVKFPERLEVCLKRFPDSESYRPAGMIIRVMRQRWGSMSAARRLVLNRILVQASVDAIDYVITHELCHLSEPHHGPAFLHLLERIMPDWEARKLKLERQLA